MNNLLLIPSSVDSSFVDEWIKKCGEKLDIIYIVDETLPDEVSSWMLYTGFLGEKPTEDVVRAVREEMEIRGKERIESLKARFDNVREARTISGNPEDLINEFADKYTKIFIVEKKKIEEVK